MSEAAAVDKIIATAEAEQLRQKVKVVIATLEDGSRVHFLPEDGWYHRTRSGPKTTPVGKNDYFVHEIHWTSPLPEKDK